MKPLISMLCFFLLLVAGCNGRTVTKNTGPCRQLPAFIGVRTGFDPQTSYFSSSVISNMGLVLVEQKQAGTRIFQDSSWQLAGWLGQIELDENGNLFTAPAPFINILHNPPSSQNEIFMVDSKTGRMSEFLRLPGAAADTSRNPYGVLAISYDCRTRVLYASSIAGSSESNINGVIYAINVPEKRILDSLKGIDVFGIGLNRTANNTALWLGNARTGNIERLLLSENGSFTGQPETAGTLTGLGPNGDDHARKLEMLDDSTLSIQAMSFNYNLIPGREKQETTYLLHVNSTDHKLTRIAPTY